MADPPRIPWAEVLPSKAGFADVLDALVTTCRSCTPTATVAYRRRGRFEAAVATGDVADAAE